MANRDVIERNMVDPANMRRGGNDERHRLELLLAKREELAARIPSEELRPTWFAYHHGLTGMPPEAFNPDGTLTAAARARARHDRVG